MCGIAGIASRSGKIDNELLSTMAQRMAHRGPDDSGSYCHHWAGLAHTRLSIIDLNTGHQPLIDDTGQLILIANGEIYNHKELRRELQAKGRVFQTHSDSEVILHAYAEYGIDCLEHLHGMFAFALLDRRLDRLLLARDRLGIKPLFVATLPDAILFASEIKALLPGLPHGPRVNPGALAQFLQVNFSTSRQTLFEGVERLLPGEAMLIEPNCSIRRWRWWSPNDIQPWTGSFQDATDYFDGLMQEVIEHHTRSDVPWGLFLSGGLDSSTLAALLAADRNSIQAWTVGFNTDDVHNETAAARSIAETIGLSLKTLDLDPIQLFDLLPHTLWAADELMGDYANLPVSVLAQQAAQTHKVVFSGEGGDEVFAGYGRYRSPAVKRWLLQLSAPGSGGFRTHGNFSRHTHKGLFSTSLRTAMDQWRRPYIEAWQSCPREFTPLQRMQSIDITTWLPDDLLVKADRMLMAWGVEGRVPFLDHRIVMFGLSLPDNFKIKARSGKVFLRQWAEKRLPRNTLQGRKKGFTVPVGRWLSGDTVRRLSTCLPENTGIKEWFDTGAVRELVRRQQHGDKHITGQLWTLVQFAVWYRLWFELKITRPPPEQLDPLDILSAREY